MTEQKNEILDIVALIENNPLTKLSGDYGSVMVSKIRQHFTTEQQQLFVSNFYCYLNYNSKTEFVILLDLFWEWIGYSRIDNCKAVLIKNFKENIDYKIEKAAPEDAGAAFSAPASSGAKNESVEEDQESEKIKKSKNIGGAGLNKEYITLTINCFKKLCLISKTTKASEIHDYYIKLEEILHETIEEQSKELVGKLQDSQKQLQLKDNEIENTLILNFKDKQVFYIIQVEPDIFKFGYTKNIEKRLNDHRMEFGKNIVLKKVIETIYHFPPGPI